MRGWGGGSCWRWKPFQIQKEIRAPFPFLTTTRPVISGASQSELGKSLAFDEIIIFLLLSDVCTSKPEKQREMFFFFVTGGREKKGEATGVQGARPGQGGGREERIPWERGNTESRTGSFSTQTQCPVQYAI